MVFTKPITELIKMRFSCRSYLELPIKEGTRRRLDDYTSSVKTGPFGSQLRYELVAATEYDRKALKNLGTYGFIKGATGFIVGAMQKDEMNLEDFGYSMEYIILYATDMGLGTCWLGGTFTKSSFAKKVSAKKGELIPAVTSVGYIANKPRMVERLIRRGANADRRLRWEQLFFDAEFNVPLRREMAGDYEIPLEMLRLAPSASNKQPWRVVKNEDNWHFYLKRTSRYRESRFRRLFTVADLQRIDMGIAMSHFELTAGELGLRGRWEFNQPSIVKPDGEIEYSASWMS
jgi:hypothetical protein